MTKDEREMLGYQLEEEMEIEEMDLFWEGLESEKALLEELASSDLEDPASSKLESAESSTRAENDFEAPAETISLPIRSASDCNTTSNVPSLKSSVIPTDARAKHAPRRKRRSQKSQKLNKARAHHTQKPAKSQPQDKIVKVPHIA